jgi:endo-alpha-N-acetylgalactosaminidase
MKKIQSSALIALIVIFFAAKVSAAGIIGSDNQAKEVFSIQSKVLKITLDKSFPSIIDYNWISNGNTFFGQEDKLSQVKINGELYTPEVSITNTRTSADYHLNFADIKVVIKIRISVIYNIVELNVIHIAENGTFKVSTFEIPNHNLLSVRSAQPGASFAGSKMYTAVKGSGDVFIPLSGEIAPDSIPCDFLYGILNTDQLSASLWSNSVTEKSDNSRVQKQTVQKNGYFRTGIWSGSWIYRAQGMADTDPLPAAKVIITNDVNADNLVDWQDGAIAFRNIMNNPLGSEKIPGLVVQRIPMNFASQATNPFTKTLDETKRVYLNTDGLGQFVILKGYGSEGHDSKHPDYGDIGKRQGGAKDMQMLCKQALKYNAFMGVHINGTESYPEAAAFDDSLVNKSKPGWDWLDASYYINKRYDATSNNRMMRFKSLKDQVPDLQFIYVDVWYAKGSWDSRKAAREIHSLGLTMATEFPQDHEYDAVWNHWAVDYNYGGVDIKGYNSQIARFIRNHQKDTWIAHHPLLGGAEMKDFEGWQGRNNYDSCIWMTFQTDLPSKYLQHFTIQKWNETEIRFSRNVKTSLVNGTRIITCNDKIVLNGDAYLLPWNPLTEEKLYHWNQQGGKTTWELPANWKNLKTVELYMLTDHGRQYVDCLKVTNGSISILADAGKPYILSKKKETSGQIVNCGEGSLINDPGFNSGDLKYWNVEGSGSSVKRNKFGQYELFIDGNTTANVSQSINSLSPGSYYASVYVSTSRGRKAYLGINYNGGLEATVYADNSLWKNYIAADSKRDTNMQRMYVFFTIPEGKTSANLFLRADEGSFPVVFDDVRIARTTITSKPDSVFFMEDFENVTDGLYPFVKGPSGGVNDPRTHLAELHAPFTQKGWNGKPVDDVINGNWSLKAHGEPTGLLLQTIPQTIRFVAGKTYTVTFKYEASGSDYGLVIGEGTSLKQSFVLNAANMPTLVTFRFVAGETGNSWFGIEKLNDKETDLVMDDLIVTEIINHPRF